MPTPTEKQRRGLACINRTTGERKPRPTMRSILAGLDPADRRLAAERLPFRQSPETFNH